MTRTSWIWLAIGLTAAALAATFVFEPKTAALLQPAAAPVPPTPLGWQAQLELVAGDGVRGMRNGAGAQARFADPYGLARSGDGTLYVADAGDNNRIRSIRPDGRVATVAGSVEGFVDGIGTAAAFNTPSGLALDSLGNLYVADTGNHAIRKISKQGVVSTLAGTGTPGSLDGPGAQAQFNGPIGVAVDQRGRVFVADTYNDRIRVIQPDGTVSTLAGGPAPGLVDGAAAIARFDTPTALALDAHGLLWVADMRNEAIRRVEPDGDVSTLSLATMLAADGTPLYSPLRRPSALAIAHDGVMYVGDSASGQTYQIRPDGQWTLLTGGVQEQRLSRPSAMVLDRDGAVYLSDGASYRVYRMAPATTQAIATVAGPSPLDPLPDTGGRWPLHPQDGWHEVVGTLGEVRGDGHQESRHHLHGGLDIRGDIGQQVLAIADAKVSHPSSSWGYGNLGEGAGLDDINYIHMRVGRTAKGEAIDPARFVPTLDETGKLERMRLRRGTRFKTGDVLGTINPMAHVHLSVGAAGYERNAVSLGFAHYADHYAPRIERIDLLDSLAQPLREKRKGRLLVSRALSGLQIVAEAWDQVDDNLPRRRLGLYALGYQWLDAAGQPLPGYEQPRMNIEFNRLPSPEDAVKTIYAPDSGVTVHGSAITRFRYVLTNTVRDGRISAGVWMPNELAAGDYTLRITARDYSGNEAMARRDLAVTLE
ncbi:gluconolaconase [Lysobacter sp. CA199]|uniref:NHL repeat-containing protein n=1 Tax=Lysobacter sp. CA199 TaxID=3455608 RepID=UPI003F8D3792